MYEHLEMDLIIKYYSLRQVSNLTINKQDKSI